MSSSLSTSSTSRSGSRSGSISMGGTSTTTTTPFSWGASSLRQLVTKVATDQSNTSVDLPGIVWLEHVNLVTGPDKEQAEYFYQDVLGCTRDLGGSFHFNLGQQQFHLAPCCNEKSGPTQTIAGSIGLCVPNLTTLKARVKDALLNNMLKDTQFAILDETEDDDDDDSSMTIQCPWGNIFHIYSLQNDDNNNNDIVATAASASPQKMTKMHSVGGTYGPHRMAVRGQAGIRYIEFACPANTSHKIAQFYQQQLNCQVVVQQQQQQHDDDDDTAAAAAAAAAVVTVGPNVHLVFTECNELPQEVIEKQQGVHICIYYAHAFHELYQRLSNQNLIWTNPRFTHLDTCDTWEEARNSRTLRFRHIIDLDDDDNNNNNNNKNNNVLLELEHETRPLMHGQYLKVPNYEPK